MLRDANGFTTFHENGRLWDHSDEKNKLPKKQCEQGEVIKAMGTVSQTQHCLLILFVGLTGHMDSKVKLKHLQKLFAVNAS